MTYGAYGEKYYDVKPLDIMPGQIFSVRELDGTLVEYKLDIPAYTKNTELGICYILESTHMKTGTRSVIEYNSSYPRELFVNKLQSNYRRV